MTSLIVIGDRLRRVSLPAVVLLAALYCASACGAAIEPGPRDHHITNAVMSILSSQHLTAHPLDDEISERCVKSFVKTLDPMKVYFYASDIESFNRKRDALDDLIKEEKYDEFIDFGYTVFETFMKRIQERVSMIDELLLTEHDFTVDEEMSVDRDKLEFAVDRSESWEKWRKRIKYDLLTLKSEGVEGQEAIDKLTRRYHSFAKRMDQTDSDELLEMYLTSMTTSYDPHTTYMSSDTLENFEMQMRLELEGIGAALMAEDGYTIVSKIIPGGAADKDGRLKPEYKIVGVGEGVDGEIQDVVGMKLGDVVKKIRGHRGTVVRLQVTSVAKPEAEIINITREKILLTDSEAQAEIFEEGTKPDGSPFKLGVIDLPSFYMDMDGARRGDLDFKSTSRDVRKILEDFNSKGVDAVVLDLRRNGGGSLQESINLTGLFIEDGPVVQVKDSAGRVQTYPDLDEGIVWKGPLVVLISKFSASASEILAGAIQDYRRGLIVGDHSTHGKGTVQSLMDLGQQLLLRRNAMGALKITMQQFYRPSGESTQKQGVLADVELPSLTTHLDVGESDLDYPVAFDEVTPLRFRDFHYVDDAIRDRLKDLSQRRRQQSDDFKKVIEDIGRYEEQKERKSIMLNEEKFMAERKQLNAENEEKKQFEEMADPNKSGIERDFYLDEALAITLDYLQQLVQLAQVR